MRKRRYLSAVAVATAAAGLIVAQAASSSAAPAPILRGAAAPIVARPVFKPLTAAQAAQLSQNADRPVVVVLKDQPSQVPAGSASARLRADAVGVDQRSLVTELAQVHATHVKQFQLVNSV